MRCPGGDVFQGQFGFGCMQTASVGPRCGQVRRTRSCRRRGPVAVGRSAPTWPGCRGWLRCSLEHGVCARAPVVQMARAARCVGGQMDARGCCDATMPRGHLLRGRRQAAGVHPERGTGLSLRPYLWWWQSPAGPRWVLGLWVPCRRAAGSAPTRVRELCAHTCSRSHAVGVYLLTAHMRRLQKAENVNCMQICIY